jgi:DNA repair protein RadC
MNYIISLSSCKVDAKNEQEAKAKALGVINVREAAPLVILPLNVFECLKEFRDKKKEHFIVLHLNTQNEIIKREIVSIGSLNASLVHAREVFRSAIIAECAAILICHNHPSGSLEPSAEDLSVTRRLTDAGKILGVEVTDHVIISQNGYYSFREHRLI